MPLVKAYIGNRQVNMPLEDYLNIRAMSYGYDSYAEMKSEGMDIHVPEKDIIED